MVQSQKVTNVSLKYSTSQAGHSALRYAMRLDSLHYLPGALPPQPLYLGKLQKGSLATDTSKSKRLQGKLKAGPETLVVGDVAVKDVQRMCSKT